MLAGALAAGLLSGCMKSANSRRPVSVTSLPAHSALSPSYSGVLPAGIVPPMRLMSTPAGSEELWIIARSSDTTTAATEETPGSGALMAKLEQKEVPMPLKHTDVRASVAGYIGSVEVVQQFHNPYSSKIEAVYVFPLPHNAAVNEFIMTIGERRIRGIIRERKEAEAIYAAAESQGYVAALLT